MSDERPTTPAEGSLGGRRRRRLEAEAARAAGASSPLSRKEIRRRRLEEEARLAAIATGELPMMEAETPALSRRELREQRRRELGAIEPEDTDSRDLTPPERPGEITGTGRRPVVRAPHTASAIRSLDETGALSGVQPVVRETGDPEEYAPEASSDPAEWSGTFTPVSAEIPLAGTPSPAPDPDPSPPQGSAARPRPAGSPSGPAQPAWRAVTAASPASSVDALLPGQPPNRRSMRDRMDAPAPSARTSRYEPATHSSAGTAAPIGAAEEAGRSARSAPEPVQDPGPVNPVVRVVRVLALVLAAILIGVLITLLWLDQNAGDEDPQARAFAPGVTEIALPLPPAST